MHWSGSFNTQYSFKSTLQCAFQPDPERYSDLLFIYNIGLSAKPLASCPNFDGHQLRVCWSNIVGGPEVERASDSLPSLVLRSPSLHWRRSAGTDSCNSTRLDWVSHFVKLNRYSDAVSLKRGFWFLPFQSLTSSEPWFERVKLLFSSVDCYTSEYFLQKCTFPGWKGLNNLKLHQPGRSWMVLQDLWQFTHLPHTLSSNNRLLSFKFWMFFLFWIAYIAEILVNLQYSFHNFPKIVPKRWDFDKLDMVAGFLNQASLSLKLSSIECQGKFKILYFSDNRWVSRSV